MDKQIERHGLENANFTISDGALKKIISGYTKEAGVRGLERRIGDICRKADREILKKKYLHVVVTELIILFRIQYLQQR